MKKDRFIAGLIELYIILFSIRILVLPNLEKKLQPGDILFFVIFMTALTQLPSLKKIRFLRFDITVIFWLLTHIITYFFHPTKESLLELIGTIYLVTLYASINILLIDKSKEYIRNLFFRGIGLSAFVLMFFGLVGVLMVALGYPNMFVMECLRFPYFGDIYRMKGLTGHPIMMASINGLFLLVLITEFIAIENTKNVFWKKLTLGMLIIGLPFAFAKSIVVTFICSIGIFMNKYIKQYRYTAILVFSTLLIFYTFSTHFVLVKKFVFENQKDNMFLFLDKANPLLSVGDNFLIKTGYALLKEKAWYIFTQNPLVGIGAGNINVEPFAIDKPNYAFIKGFDPHSSITGSLAEMGILGFLAFFSIFIIAFREIYLLLKTNLNSKDLLLLYGFLGIFIFMICEAISTDVMNFRHFWLIFAFFAAWMRKFSVSKI